jgi:hypothetical protein
MTYAQYGTIQATDYNTLVGGDPTTTSGTLNAVWAIGGNDKGYGQTALGNVNVGAVVQATEWASLVNRTANAALHQGTAITSVTAPAVGNVIAALTAIPTNLTTIYNSRLNATSQGATISNAAVYASTWSTALTFVHIIDFPDGNAARYFFNSGGQLKVTCSHANTTAGINLLFNGLASNIGTVAMSAQTSGSISIAGSSFNGITKVGGGGTAPTISTNSGYYSMTTSNVTVFTQLASGSPAGYLDTFIRVIAKSNGTQGSYSDAGSIITLYTIWDEVPNGLTVGTGSTTTVTVAKPETTYIANSWGAISVTGSVSGS